MRAGRSDAGSGSVAVGALLDAVVIGALLVVVSPLDDVLPILPVVLLFSAVLGLYGYRS